MRILAATAAVAAVLATTGGAASQPAGFSAHVDNPWYPLLPGTRYLYTGVKDSKPSRDVLTVTHRTRTIEGAPCVVVEDRLYLRGRLAERTTDWYSQDARGDVWYFGENTPPNSTSTATSRAPRAPGQPESTARSPASTCPPIRASASRDARSTTKDMLRTTTRSSGSSAP